VWKERGVSPDWKTLLAARMVVNRAIALSIKIAQVQGEDAVAWRTKRGLEKCMPRFWRAGR
jgi:hypothetical protein